MKSKYTDSWLVKKIFRKNKISQKIPLDTFLSEDFSEKNEARDQKTGTMLKLQV